MTDIDTIEFKTRPRPKLESNDVLVKVRDIGICGSDVHYLTEGQIGDFVVEDPLILGHEVAGEIVETGDEVDTHAVGQEVAIEPGIPCRRCEYCKRGEYHLCEDITFMATPPNDGAFVEYIAWPADFVYPLPSNVSTREGALCEPLSVGIHACRRANIGVGDTVLITGSGPIGLLVMETVRNAGASTILVSDVIDEKLDRAESRGATETVNVEKRRLVDAVDAVTDGRGVDVAIEASGAPEVYKSVLQSVRSGGTITCVGLSSESEIAFDFVDMTVREVDLQGSFRYANTYETAINLLQRGVVDVEGIIDEEFTFENIETAFEMSQEPEVVKTMISM